MQPRLRHIGLDEKRGGVDDLYERCARRCDGAGCDRSRCHDAREGRRDGELAQAGAERLNLCVGGLHIGLGGGDAGIEHGELTTKVVEVCSERDAGGNQPLLPLKQACGVGPLRFRDLHPALRCCAARLGRGYGSFGILGVEFKQP